MDKTKILVVEDEVIVAMEMKQQLENLGYDVVGVANTGKEAVDISLEKNPDVILMDIMLKGDMDGIEAAEKIRGFQDNHIIYTTAYSDAELLERAKLTEPNGYILKPLISKEVDANIQMALYKNKIDKEDAELPQRLAAIIPAYNEQVAIGSMVLNTKLYVDRVIVVDDGSSDKTAEVAVLAGA